MHAFGVVCALISFRFPLSMSWVVRSLCQLSILIAYELVSQNLSFRFSLLCEPYQTKKFQNWVVRSFCQLSILMGYELVSQNLSIWFGSLCKPNRGFTILASKPIYGQLRWEPVVCCPQPQLSGLQSTLVGMPFFLVLSLLLLLPSCSIGY